MYICYVASLTRHPGKRRRNRREAVDEVNHPVQAEAECRRKAKYEVPHAPVSAIL